MEFVPTAMQNLFILEGQGFETAAQTGDFDTYSGVTQPVYSAYLYANGLPDASVQYITDSQLNDIYYRDYWRACKCDQLPDGIDFMVFQAAVNAGSGHAAKWLQAVVGTTQDGVIGPQTISAVNQYVALYGTAALADAYLAQQKAYYEAIVAANPARQSTLQGWYNRLTSTYSMISDAFVAAGQAVVAGAEAALGAVEDNPGTSAFAVLLFGAGVFF